MHVELTGWVAAPAADPPTRSCATTLKLDTRLSPEYFRLLSLRTVSSAVTLSDTWRDGASAPKRVAQRHCYCPKLGADDVVHRRGHRFCLRCDQRVWADRQHHPHQDVLLCQIHPQRAKPVHVQPGAGRCFTAGDLRPGGREPLPVRGVAVRESGL